MIESCGKTEAVEHLKASGYNATIECGMPTVIVTYEEYSKHDKLARKIKNVLHKINYDGCWGVRPERKKIEAADS